jgi:hypothetical protein
MADLLDIRVDTTKFFSALGMLLKILPDELREKAMRQSFRRLMQRIQDWTPPHSGKRGSSGPEAQKQGAAAVRRDLLRIVTIVEPEVLEFWQTVNRGRRHIGHLKLNRKDGTEYELTDLELDPEGSSIGRHHQRERDRRGRVRKGAKKRVVTTADRFRAYLEQPQAHVGIAKGGWLPAMSRLGGVGVAWIARHGGQGGSYHERFSSKLIEFTARNASKSIGSLAPRLVRSSMRAETRAIIRDMERATKSAAGMAKLTKRVGNG